MTVFVKNSGSSTGFIDLAGTLVAMVYEPLHDAREIATIIANSALRASLAVYHLISIARARGITVNY